MTISLLDFFRTAQFGPVSLGMFREQLKNLLGNPIDWMVNHEKKKMKGWTKEKDKQHSLIWKYGSIEFHFTTEDSQAQLWMIFTDHFPLKGCSTFTIDKDGFQENFTVAEALSYFQSHNLSPITRFVDTLQTTEILLESKIVFSFDSEEEYSSEKKLGGFWINNL